MSIGTGLPNFPAAAESKRLDSDAIPVAVMQIVTTPKWAEDLKSLGEHLDMEPDAVIEYAVQLLQDAVDAEDAAAKGL